MPERLALVALIVPDYNEALAFFVGRLGFELREDSALGGGKRWVRIGLPGAATEILLASALGDAQTAAIGNQGGGRVWLFLKTADFDRNFAAFTAAGVRFEAPPRDEPYGRVAVFSDPWGNRWDLIQQPRPDRAAPRATPSPARSSGPAPERSRPSSPPGGGSSRWARSRAGPARRLRPPP